MQPRLRRQRQSQKTISFMSKINSYARTSSFFFYLDKVIKNSTLGEIAYIWQIERDQTDAIKFERTQINILSDVLTSVVAVVTWAS